MIDARPATIYALAARTEQWPSILPHYRFVRVLKAQGNSRIVEMGAWRGRIPIRWIAEQKNDPERLHVAFRHIRGWTKGMEVEWLLEPCEGGTRVRIQHRLSFAFPVAQEWLGEHVVTRGFIRPVADKTLACMKRIAESRECTASA
ncbi:MAG: SRPBCC family protein [Candidatus Eremiobacteraeota bacterium]|nr:SRPBCC family protein [Candidatus Eremiobacteraeota bacterium]